MSESDKKDFVWKAVRISFYVFVVLFVIMIISLILAVYLENFDTGFIIYLVSFWLAFIALIFNFITAIIHLTKHKEKGFAITSLVISSIFLLLGLISFIAGTFSPDTSTYDDTDMIEQYVDSSCKDFCTGVDKVESYDYEYDNQTDSVICYCLDIDDETIIQKNIPAPE